MARTPSNMLALDTVAPSFELKDSISGSALSLETLKSDKCTVIMFICNHCPFVIHLHDGIMSMVKEYQAKGVSFIAISSNDIDNYPQDSPDKMKLLAQELDFTFPYLYDETQEVARAYEAACTPDFYIFDGALKCKYRGQFDASRPGNEIPVTGSDLRSAIDSILAGRPVDEHQLPSLGCNIKWKV